MVRGSMRNECARKKKKKKIEGKEKEEEKSRTKNSIFRETFARHWDALRRTKLRYGRAWKFDWPAAALMISCARERESFASHQRLLRRSTMVPSMWQSGCKQRSRPNFILFNFATRFILRFLPRQWRGWILLFLLLLSISKLVRFEIWFFFSYRNRSGLSFILTYVEHVGNEKQRDGWYKRRRLRKQQNICRTCCPGDL